MDVHVKRTKKEAITEFFSAIGRKLLSFVIALGKALLGIFIGAYRGIISLGKAIKKGVLSFGRTFKNGDLKTRLSYFIMGYGCFTNYQIVKGVSYLLLQVLFIIFMVFFGGQALVNLVTLGVNVGSPPYEDPETGLIVPGTMPDDSMKFLLFGVGTVLILICFIGLYLSQIKLAAENQRLLAQDKYPNDFKAEVKDLLDRKFYKPILAIPLILVTIFTVVPLIFMILVAFTNYDSQHIYPSDPFSWVGFGSFVETFSRGGNYAKSLGNTLVWTLIWAVLATVLNYVFGMILAILINKKGIRLKKMWRTIFVITIAVPQFVTLMSVSYLLGDNGFINSILTQWGWIDEPIRFLSTTTNARITVIIVNLWVGVPYSMLITSGILMNIPEDLYESSKIDGAGPVAQFMKITLPYMLFVTGPYLITQFIGNINNFNVIFFLTGGNPVRFDYASGGTDLLVTWLYKLVLNDSQYNVASVLGILVFSISAFVSLLMYNNINATKDEEAFR